MNYSALKAKIATYAGGTTDAAMLADMTSTASAGAVTITNDIQARDIRDTLYARGSWDRVLQLLHGGLITTPTAATKATCQMLVDLVNSNDAFRLSIPGVETKAAADLTALQTTKAADGKGILWAANELSAGDPGDVSVLSTQLSTVKLSWADANGCTGVTENDLIAARLTP